MPTNSAYHMRFGSRRIPWMIVKEGHDGSQYVIFPMDRTGFKISMHPMGANPHMKDTHGLYQELDLVALRAVNWDEVAAKEFQPWWESLFYWPSHRADLIAIPGPEGKTWLEGVQELFRGDEMDVMELLKMALGYGTIYKVGYRDRIAFFETPLGRGCVIIDPREERFGFYAPGPFPERPLLGMRWKDGGFAFPMPPPLHEWKETLDVRLELATEQYVEDYENELEAAISEVLPEMQAFVDQFRVVRWRPDGPPS